MAQDRATRAKLKKLQAVVAASLSIGGSAAAGYCAADSSPEVIKPLLSWHNRISDNMLEPLLDKAVEHIGQRLQATVRHAPLVLQVTREKLIRLWTQHVIPMITSAKCSSELLEALRQDFAFWTARRLSKLLLDLLKELKQSSQHNQHQVCI